MSEKEMFENAKVFTPEVLLPQETPVGMLAQGKAIARTQTQYHTAIAVQKPRNLDQIISALDREAQYGGESFYYSWSVKDKKTGKKTIVEGCSIGAAMAIAREFGNCAVPVDVQEGGDSFIFTASFVDIEKGFTISRVYRHKKKPIVGKYDADRWEDMEFQKGQSKALRNVVLAGVPKWLSERVLRKSKEAVIAGIGKEGLDVARDKVVRFLAGKGVSLERVEAVVGRKLLEWGAEDVASLRGMCSQIHDGQASAESLFPEVEIPEKKETEKKEAVSEKKTSEVQGLADQVAVADRARAKTDATIQKFMEEIDTLKKSVQVDQWRSKHHQRVSRELPAENDYNTVMAYANDRYIYLKDQEELSANA